MFDYSPKEDVPWYDGSLARLYDYFEEKPEIWKDADLFLKVNSAAVVLLLLFCQNDGSLSFALGGLHKTTLRPGGTHACSSSCGISVARLFVLV